MMRTAIITVFAAFSIIVGGGGITQAQEEGFEGTLDLSESAGEQIEYFEAMLEHNGDVDRIAKMIPAEIGISIEQAIEKVPELKELIKTDPQYEQRLKLMGPKLYKALREGNWDVIEGAAFEELGEVHRLPAHEPPEGAHER